MNNPDFYSASDIAIIGKHGRFTCANNLREFWHNLENRV